MEFAPGTEIKIKHESARLCIVLQASRKCVCTWPAAFLDYRNARMFGLSDNTKEGGGGQDGKEEEGNRDGLLEPRPMSMLPCLSSLK